jgi:hypothetical protein
MDAITGANLKIARRAFAQARADFATWQMMAKLRSEATLSPEAQAALAAHAKLVQSKTMTEDVALEQSIQALYRRYYVEMGGTGLAPDSSALILNVVPRQQDAPLPSDNNVTPFRPRPKAKASRTTSQSGKRPMPVALIFIAMVAVAVLFKYLFP